MTGFVFFRMKLSHEEKIIVYRDMNVLCTILFSSNFHGLLHTYCVYYKKMTIVQPSYIVLDLSVPLNTHRKEYTQKQKEWLAKPSF